MEKLMTLVATKEGLATTQQEQFDQLKERLGKLGFNALTAKVETARRLAIAYAKYGVITNDKVMRFNEKLRKESEVTTKDARFFKRLLFTPIEKYGKIPPPEALRRLEDAIKDNIFDGGFEVAAVHEVQELIDPIIFGRINGTSDRFFIAQWDDDVKIEDIVDA